MLSVLISVERIHVGPIVLPPDMVSLERVVLLATPPLIKRICRVEAILNNGGLGIH